MVRAEVFRAVGGFDDQLRVANNDVDLGLRIGARGWRVLYTPWAELTHAESASRGPLHPLEDERRFIARWGAAGTLRDPFWDVNLDIPEIDLLAI
jgi:GT2 family glycosyltransferase